MSTLNAGVQGDNVILPAAKEIALTTLSLKVWGDNNMTQVLYIWSHACFGLLSQRKS